MEHTEEDHPAAPRPRRRWVWALALAVWFVLLAFVPDPRPLGAAPAVVSAVREVTGVAEPAARVFATVLTRGLSMLVLGVLVAQALWSGATGAAGGVRSRPGLGWIAVALPAACVLAVAAPWLNYGYFPVAAQLWVALPFAAAGALLGLGLRRSRTALALAFLGPAALFLWGASLGISDDLDAATRAVGLHVLEHAGEIPDGDEGFLESLRIAFAFAEERSRDADAAAANRAAVLALGVLLGSEHTALLARRHVAPEHQPEMEALRARLTLRGRADLVRHFWVSAALTVLGDEERSMSVGLTKELMDTTPGGTGFSFSDLVGDRAGTLFARAATRNDADARALQALVRGGLRVDDVLPPVTDLPDGITRDELQEEYGGLGGARTNELVEEIRRRLAECAALR